MFVVCVCLFDSFYGYWSLVVDHRHSETAINPVVGKDIFVLQFENWVVSNGSITKYYVPGRSTSTVAIIMVVSPSFSVPLFPSFLHPHCSSHVSPPTYSCLIFLLVSPSFFFVYTCHLFPTLFLHPTAQGTGVGWARAGGGSTGVDPARV